MKNYKELLVEKINSKLPKNLEILLKDLRISLNKRNSVYLCGNGGSAANANHIANDFLYGLSSKLKKGLNVESLSSNVAVITCLANDIGYENTFYMQMKGLIKQKDIVIAISCSGDSPNILKAADYAQSIGCKVIGITGFDGGRLKSISDINFHVDAPKNEYGLVEDTHMILDHIIYSYYNQK